jgi:hypothetical protein
MIELLSKIIFLFILISWAYIITNLILGIMIKILGSKEDANNNKRQTNNNRRWFGRC